MKIKLGWLLGLLLMLLGNAAMAQDIMIMKDGEEIVAKVVEITPTLVKYRPYSNLDGPLISVDRTTVFMIKYENGSKDVMNPTDQPAKPEEKQPENSQEEAHTTPSNGPTVTYSRVDYHRKKRDREIYNQVKVNLLAVANGDIPLSYERRISDHVSVEGGAGITFPNGFLTQLVYLDYLDIGDHAPRLGYSAKAGLHLFPNRDVMALDEWYVGPELGFRNYRTAIESCNGTPVSNPVNESRMLFDFKMTGGFMSYVADAVLFDFYASLGVRYRVLSTTDCEWNGSTWTIPAPRATTNIGPMIGFGVKFGFGW